MATPPLVDRARVVRAVRMLEIQVLAVGVLIPALTTALVASSGIPRPIAVIPIGIGTVIAVWAIWWYGSLARAAATGDSTLAVVITRKQSFDHVYLDVQPIDGSPPLGFVVPSRHRVLDGHPTELIGDRNTGRMVLASATAISIPLRPAAPQ